MIFPIPILMYEQATKEEKKKALNYCNKVAPLHIAQTTAGKRQIIHLHFHLTRSEELRQCAALGHKSKICTVCSSWSALIYPHLNREVI